MYIHRVDLIPAHPTALTAAEKRGHRIAHEQYAIPGDQFIFLAMEEA